MTMRYPLIVALLACVLGQATAAMEQKAPPPPPPTTETPAPRPSPPLPPVNIQIDLTIQSQGPETPSLSKSFTTIVANGANGSFRVQQGDQAPRANGDFRAEMRDGRIEVGFSLDVFITEGNGPGLRYRGSYNRILVENGNTLAVAKVPDPLTNRTLTIAIKATILK